MTTRSTERRRYVLAAIVAAVGLAASAILLEVLGTVVLAITVAFVLAPVQRLFSRRGLPEWWAAVAATVLGFLGAVAVVSPVAATLYFRRERLVEAIDSLPEEVTVTAFETSVTVHAADVQSLAVERFQGWAIATATAAPELAVKFALFGILLFGLLLEGDAAARAIVAPVPREYRDVVVALGRRAHETLYAIYVLQLATAAATLVVAVPLFWALGYDNAFLLGMLAALLQFVPIIGPSFLVVPLALYHVAVGQVVAGLLVGVLGIVLVGWLPDTLVRPRLARRTADMPGSLYFVGFTGGLFTLGPIGIVVGPLVVAVFVEAVDLLANEINDDEVPTIEEIASPEELPASGPEAADEGGNEPPSDEPSTEAGAEPTDEGVVGFDERPE